MHLLHSGWAAILGYHAGMCLLLWAGGGWPGAVHLARGWAWKEGAACTALCAAAGPVILVLWPLAGAPVGPLGVRLASLGLQGASWWAFAAYYVLVNPFLEELYWRGWLAPASRHPAPVDALFAGYHAVVLVLFVDWPWVLFSFVCLLAPAWLWRRLSRRCGGLAVPAFSHLAADASVIAAAIVISSRMT
ncbi:MAG: CPBP family intramembrane metalloprotease [Deltaproteobacteria bacterium]|nr:CPBP family intramembrane metalloprotease [Deltaproteobacteria bacterium]